MVSLLQRDEATAAGWRACRFLTCSVLPVRVACNLRCPFCFSKSSVSALRHDRAGWRRMDVSRYYEFARDRGATRLVVTGGGEPLLRSEDVIYLVGLGRRYFDEIACFTNGTFLTRDVGRRLHDAGLSYVCYSRHAADDETNRRLMGDRAPRLADFVAAAGPLKVRATCVMTRGSVEDADGVWEYVEGLRPFGVTEFTFKHTYVAYDGSLFRGSAEDAWAREHQVEFDPFGDEGEVMAALPWGPARPPHQGGSGMLLPRTDAAVGTRQPNVPVEQPAFGRLGVRLAGGIVEPLVPAELLVAAVGDQVEHFRPLLPVGYAAGVEAYRAAVADLTPADFSSHYTAGLGWFRSEFVPRLKETLRDLSGGAWDLSDFDAYAAGSDVDFMTHLVEAVAAHEEVCLYPGDWFGFRVGSTHPAHFKWDPDSRGRLACLCVPSVRNGHVTADMMRFLDDAGSCLLNLNLFPTLESAERRSVAESLTGVLGKSVLSISFSRGFGLTASQLGVALVPRGHPYQRRYGQAWEWFTYFFNGLAARAFLGLDLTAVATVDAARREWVNGWLRGKDLPTVASGSYYVKAFRTTDGEVPEPLQPLARDGLIRLCLKPPQV